MDTEASTIISSITAVLEAAAAIAVAFGLDFTDTQRNAIIGAVAPLVLITFLLGPVIRSFVWSKKSVKEVVAVAHVAGATGTPPPPVI